MMSVLGGVVCFYSLFVPIHDFRDLAKTLLSEFQALDSYKAFVAFLLVCHGPYTSST